MGRGFRVVVVAVVLLTAVCAGGCSGGGGTALSVRSRSCPTPRPATSDCCRLTRTGRGPSSSPFTASTARVTTWYELAKRVAAGGALVFAPTYSTDVSSPEGMSRTADDVVCAYRLVLRTAPDHGGDLSEPVTVVGWSLGADLAVLGTLQESPNTSTRCPGEVKRPGVVVAMGGCYYRFAGNRVTWFDDAGTWRGTSAVRVTLVDGDHDTVCPSWQTDRLSTSLRSAGYHVEVVRLSGANHYAPVFHDVRGGRFEVITQDPAGERAVTAILDAMTTAGATGKPR